MKKFGIDCGHTLSGGDTGASYIFVEQEKTREIGHLVMNKLRVLGYGVVDCTCDSGSLNESLAHRYNTANSNKVDEFVSIHLNAGGGDGVEVLINSTGSHSEEMAHTVLDAIINQCGYENRGVKVAKEYLGYNLAVLKNTEMSAILIECGFTDSETDCNLYNADKISSAIVQGLTGEVVSTSTPTTCSTPSTSVEGKVATVNANGGLNVRSGGGTNYPVIGSLNKGARVQLFKVHGDWTEIYFGNNGGFVLSKYLTEASTNTVITKGVVICDILNIREEDNVNSRILGTLKHGETVNIYKKYGEWYSIYFGEHGGYVSAKYIKGV